MQIDLQTAEFRYMTLNVSFAMARDTLLELWEKSFDASEDTEVFDGWRSAVARYQLAQSRVTLMVQAMLEDTSRSHIFVHYQKEGEQGSLSDDQVLNAERLAVLFDSIGMRCSVSCWAHSELPGAEFTPIIGLPLIKFQEPHPPFDEVSGIRLVKRTGETEQNTTSLHLTKDNNYSVSVNLAFDGILDSSLPRRAFKQLLSWRERAIWRTAGDQD